MGFTVSTNLGLIKPDTDESIREDLPTFAGWATQNEDNMDVIDGLFRNNNTTYALAWGATVTPPTLGATGFVEGKFIRLWPRMVIVFFRIYTGGAGFAAGSGSYTLTVPVAVDPEFADFSHTAPMGKMTFLDSATVVTSSVMPLIYSQPSNRVFARPAEGGTWTNALPVIPGQQDRYSGYFMYPTAVV